VARGRAAGHCRPTTSAGDGAATPADGSAGLPATGEVARGHATTEATPLQRSRPARHLRPTVEQSPRCAIVLMPLAVERCTPARRWRRNI
jgi:hypothetical protein